MVSFWHKLTVLGIMDEASLSLRTVKNWGSELIDNLGNRVFKFYYWCNIIAQRLCDTDDNCFGLLNVLLRSKPAALVKHIRVFSYYHL